MDAARKRAVELNPYDMGARGVLGICHFVIGEHRQAIELFSMAAQRDNSDPRYQWAARERLQPLSVAANMTRRCPRRGKRCYINPESSFRCSAMRAAALAQLERTARSGKGDRSPAGQVSRPDRRTAPEELSLEDGPGDTAHYREGLVKAGVPSRDLDLVESGAQRTATT